MVLDSGLPLNSQEVPCFTPLLGPVPRYFLPLGLERRVTTIPQFSEEPFKL